MIIPQIEITQFAATGDDIYTGQLFRAEAIIENRLVSLSHTVGKDEWERFHHDEKFVQSAVKDTLFTFITLLMKEGKIPSQPDLVFGNDVPDAPTTEGSPGVLPPPATDNPS